MKIFLKEPYLSWLSELQLNLLLHNFFPTHICLILYLFLQGAFALCRVVQRNDHLHRQGEPKRTVVLPSTSTEIHQRSCNSEVTNLLDLNNGAFPATLSSGNSFEAVPAMADAFQTKYQSPLVLSDASEVTFMESGEAKKANNFYQMIYFLCIVIHYRLFRLKRTCLTRYSQLNFLLTPQNLA